MANDLERSLGTVLRDAIERLAAARESARLDAEVLLAHVLDAPRHRPYVYPHEALDAARLRRYRCLIERRQAGEPVAYLTGRREFWSLDLEVTPDTLIPRPETEHLVECALALVPREAAWRIADIGTGCGAVALALASERPSCELLASDTSIAALAVARRNAHRLGLTNVRFQRGDGCDALDDPPYEIIVSNPPYLADTDPHLVTADVRFEPRTALVAGPDGLAVIRRIAGRARRFLAPGGHLLLEHGFDQGERVRTLLAEHGYVDIVTRRDYAGHERITRARPRELRSSNFCLLDQ